MEGKTLTSLAFFLLAFIVFSQTVSCNSIPRRYLIVGKPVTFDEAVQLCLLYGMEIASPTSAEENTTLANALEETIARDLFLGRTDNFKLGIWIGARKAPKASANFYWINTGKPLLFSHFQPGQPDNYGNNEYCIHLEVDPTGNYGWNDFRCDQEVSFACQNRVVMQT